MELNLILATFFLNYLFVYLAPRFFTRPTGIQLIDDTVLYLNSTKGFILSSGLVNVLVACAADYWVKHPNF